ncbi:F-box domain [Trinorchestia longiramus]|nr:F-box domain [Trinorchestia longiramus]
MGDPPEHPKLTLQDGDDLPPPTGSTPVLGCRTGWSRGGGGGEDSGGGGVVNRQCSDVFFSNSTKLKNSRGVLDCDAGSIEGETESAVQKGQSEGIEEAQTEGTAASSADHTAASARVVHHDASKNVKVFPEASSGAEQASSVREEINTSASPQNKSFCEPDHLTFCSHNNRLSGDRSGGFCQVSAGSPRCSAGSPQCSAGSPQCSADSPRCDKTQLSKTVSSLDKPTSSCVTTPSTCLHPHPKNMNNNNDNNDSVPVTDEVLSSRHTSAGVSSVVSADSCVSGDSCVSSLSSSPDKVCQDTRHTNQTSSFTHSELFSSHSCADTHQPAKSTNPDTTDTELCDMTASEPRDTTAQELHDTTATELRDTTATEGHTTEPHDTKSESRDTSELCDTIATEICDTTPPEVRDTTATELHDTTATELQDTTVPEPRNTAPVLHDTTGTELHDTTDTEPRDTTDTEPRDTTATEPRDTTATDPRDTTATEPRDTTDTEPRDTTDTESSPTKRPGGVSGGGGEEGGRCSQGSHSDSPPTEGDKWSLNQGSQELSLNSSPVDGDKWSQHHGCQDPNSNLSPVHGKTTCSITSPKTPAGQPGGTVDPYTTSVRDPPSGGSSSSDPVIPVMGYCPKDSCTNPMTPYPTPPYPTPPYNTVSGGMSGGPYPSVNNVYSNSCAGYSGATSYPTPSTPSSGYTNPNTPCSSYVNPNTPTSGCGTDSTPNSSYHNPNTPGSSHQNPNTPNSTFVGMGDTPSYGQGSNPLCPSGDTPNTYNQTPSSSLCGIPGEPGPSYGPSPPGATSSAPQSQSLSSSCNLGLDTSDVFNSGLKSSFSSSDTVAVTSSPPGEPSGLSTSSYTSSGGAGAQENSCSMYRYYSNSSAAANPYGAKESSCSQKGSGGSCAAASYAASSLNICPVAGSNAYSTSDSGGYAISGSSSYVSDGPLGYSSSGSLLNASSSGYHNSGSSNYQNLGSNGYQNPGSNGYQNPGSNGYQNPGSNGYQNPGSNGYQNPGSNGYQNPGSNGYQNPSSNGYPTPNSNGYPNPGSNSYVSPTTPGSASNPAPSASYSNPTTPGNGSYSNPNTPASGYGGLSTPSSYGNPKTPTAPGPTPSRLWETYNMDKSSQSSQFAGTDNKSKASLLTEFEKCSKMDHKTGPENNQNHLSCGASNAGIKTDSYSSSSLANAPYSNCKTPQDDPPIPSQATAEGNFSDSSMSSPLEAFSNLSKKDAAALRELIETSNLFLASNPDWKNSDLAKFLGPDGMGNLSTPEKYLIDQMAQYSLATEKLDKYSLGGNPSGTQALEALAHMTNSQPHDMIIPQFMQNNLPSSMLPSRTSMGLNMGLGMPGPPSSGSHSIPPGLGSIPSSFSDSFMHERYMHPNTSHMMSGILESMPPHAMKGGYDMTSPYMVSMKAAMDSMSAGNISNSGYEPWMPQMNLGEAASSSSFVPQHKGNSSRGSSRSNTPASANYSSSPLPGYAKMQPHNSGPSSHSSETPPSYGGLPPHALDMVPRRAGADTSMSGTGLSMKSGNVDSLLASSEGPSVASGSSSHRPNISGSMSHSMNDLAQHSYPGRPHQPLYSADPYSNFSVASPREKADGYRNSGKPSQVNSIYSHITPDSYYNQPMVYLSEGTSINVDHRRLDCPCILCWKHQHNVRKHGVHNVRNHVSCVGRGRAGWYIRTNKYKLNMKVTPGLSLATDRPASCGSNAGATRASIAESISSTISSVISNAVAARAASDQASTSQTSGYLEVPNAMNPEPLPPLGYQRDLNNPPDFNSIPDNPGNPAFRPAENLPGNRTQNWGSPSCRANLKDYCEPQLLHNPSVRNRPCVSQFVDAGDQVEVSSKQDASPWRHKPDREDLVKASPTDAFYRRPDTLESSVGPPLEGKLVNENFSDTKTGCKNEGSLVSSSGGGGGGGGGKPFENIHNSLRRSNQSVSPPPVPPSSVVVSKMPEMKSPKPEVKLEKPEQTDSDVLGSISPADHVSLPEPDPLIPPVDTGQHQTTYTRDDDPPEGSATEVFKREPPSLPSSVASKPMPCLFETLKADVRLPSVGKPYELSKLPNAPVLESVAPSSSSNAPLKMNSLEPHVDQRQSSPAKVKSMDAAEQLYSFNDSSVESPVPSPMQHKYKKRKQKDAFPVYQSEITTDPQSSGIKLKLKLTVSKPPLPKSPSYSYTALSTFKSPTGYGGGMDSYSSSSSSSPSPYDLPYPDTSASKKRKYTKVLEGSRKRKKKSCELEGGGVVSGSIPSINPTVVLNQLKPALAKKKRGKAVLPLDSLVYKNPGFGPALSEIKGEAQSAWAHKISPEILLKIFKYSVGDDNCIPILLRLSRVCRLWRDVSLEPSLWTKADLSVPRARARFRSERKLYWLLTSRLTRVQHLNLGESCVWTGGRCVDWLDFISPEQRRLRGQLIETYKYLNGLNHVTLEALFQRHGNVRTRNNDQKLIIRNFKTSQALNLFPVKIAATRNQLPENMVSAGTVNTFKNRLDKYWIRNPPVL